MKPPLQSPMPLARADGEGYTYGGEWVDGFADRPELSLPVRVRLARLGERYAPRKLSVAQRDLLASPMAERDASRQPSPELDGFQANAQEMERAFEDGVYAELTSEQQAWVADPSLHAALASDVRYPLTLGEIHLLTGASERQLRHWSDEGLIPSHRAGAHRRYYSAAVARALLLIETPPQQVATLIALRKGGDHARRLWALVGGVGPTLADTHP
jgi:MerR family regulatory protein